MLLSVGITLVLAPSASAVVEFNVEKTLAAGAPAYFTPGDTIPYVYAVSSNHPFYNVAVSDNMCSPVNPVLGADNVHNIGDTGGTNPYTPAFANNGVLNGGVGEVWQFTCNDTAPAVNPSNDLVNTATATGNLESAVGPLSTDTDTYRLEAAVLRKQVALYWEYSHVINAPGTGAVEFGVDVFKNGSDIGNEVISANTPLSLWLTPGTWLLQEQTPPTGYVGVPGRTSFNIGVIPREPNPRLDNTIFNIAPFDLAITKTGPTMAAGGGPVTYEYTVTNTGPGVVTPTVTDDLCGAASYFSGDTALNPGKIDPSETWTFKCTYTPNWNAYWPSGDLTNTATVSDVEFPESWTPLFGGDTNASNNTDTFTLDPYIIRKDVIEWGTGNQLLDTTTFTVTIKQGSTVVGTVQIKEGDPAELWLVPGTYTFCETVLPFYIPNHECWTQTIGTDYPDWTVVNAKWYGFSHGYYKNQGLRIGWQNLTPPVAGVFAAGAKIDGTQALGTFIAFDVPTTLTIDGVWIGDKTLLQALSFQGGPDPSGKAQILLKQAVAALLNESRFGASFGDFTLAQLQANVNAALAGSESDMTDLASELDYWNNGIVV
jgi:hypothetical protein